MNDELEKLKGLLYIGSLTQYGKRKLIKTYEDIIKEKDKRVEELLENSISKDRIKNKIKEIQNKLDENYSAEKISVFSGDTYMEKFRLLGKLYVLKELLESSDINE